ncbi:MAG: twin-arginine translocase TatA/TatE family subunit [Gammaproteobacteria bacterium]
MSVSVWQVALVVVLFLVLFGKGRVPQLMSDLAEGIKGFRKGLADDAAASRPEAAADPREAARKPEPPAA